MAICNYCKKKYFNYDSDAGTYKENFCSIECAQKRDKEIDRCSAQNCEAVIGGKVCDDCILL
jgi:hypothetical protein